MEPASLPMNRSGMGSVTTVLWIAKLVSRHGEALCRVRSLSRDGLVADVHAPLVDGDTVRVKTKAGDLPSGRVSRVREGRLHLSFHRPREIDALLVRRPGPSARGPRFALDCPVEAWVNGHRHAARLVNLSLAGGRLEADCGLAPDALLMIGIPGLTERQARVRWTREQALGVAFLKPLSFDELGMWLARQGSGPDAPRGRDPGDHVQIVSERM